MATASSSLLKAVNTVVRPIERKAVHVQQRARPGFSMPGGMLPHRFPPQRPTQGPQEGRDQHAGQDHALAAVAATAGGRYARSVSDFQCGRYAGPGTPVTAYSLAMKGTPGSPSGACGGSPSLCNGALATGVAGCAAKAGGTSAVWRLDRTNAPAMSADTATFFAAHLKHEIEYTPPF